MMLIKPETRGGILRRVILVLLAMMLAFTPSNLVYAALPDEATLDMNDANGIYYYNGSGSLDDCVPITTGSNVAIIGDSIIDNVKAEIKKYLSEVVIYAAPNKIIGKKDDEAIAPTAGGNPSAMSIIKYWSVQGKMRDTIVFALGTDNKEKFTYDNVNEMLNIIGTSIHVFFVLNFSTATPDPFTDSNSIFEKAAEYSNVNIIDWPRKAGEDIGKYIADDHITPTADGRKLLAQLIDTAVGGQSSAIGSVNGEYVNYAGRVMINDTQAQQIEANKPFYQQALDAVPEASQLGLNWQIIATVHLRESGLNRTNPPMNSEGFYEGIYGLYSYGRTHPMAFSNVGLVSDAEFASQTTLLVREILLPKAQSYDLTTEDGIKEFFLSYNGYSDHWNDRAEALGYGRNKPWEGSPYVMNFYDEPRDPKSPNMSPVWAGGYPSNGYYSPTYLSEQPGAWLIYTLLGGGNGGFCGTGGMLSGGINKFEDALALLKDYQYNVRCSDYVQSALCDGFGGLQNCVAFSVYFITRFTSYKVPTAAPGDGSQIVSSMVGETLHTKLGTFTMSYDMSEGGFTYGGTTPQPYSVFSTTSSNSGGHTGVVVGVDEAKNKAYLVQAGYGTPLEYFQTQSAIERNLDELTNGNYWFAYMGSLINYAEISRSIEAGKKYI